MGYPEPEWERAMKVHEVVARALSGEIHWFRAADILGVSARTLRRWREQYTVTGYDGLLDQRRRVPSPHKVPVAELDRTAPNGRFTRPVPRARSTRPTSPKWAAP